MGGMAAFIPSRTTRRSTSRPWPRCAPTRSAKPPTGTTAPGWRIPIWCPSPRGVRRGCSATAQPDRPPAADVDVDARAIARLTVPGGTITEAGVRLNVDVGLRYLESWLCGQRRRRIYNLMEDAATAEISRSQIWQWVHHGARLDDGAHRPRATCGAVADGEVAADRAPSWATTGSPTWRFDEAARTLFERVALDPDYAEFLTFPPTNLLDDQEHHVKARITIDTDRDRRSLEAAVGRERHAGRGSSARLHRRRRGPSAGLDPRRAHAGPARRRASCGSCSPNATTCHALGAMTGGQAVQMAKAGLEAIYLSGWQVAGDANTAGQMYPGPVLYPANSGARAGAADQQRPAAGRPDRTGPRGRRTSTTSLPIVADAEAGFGGAAQRLRAHEGMIEAGAAGVHFEDQLASEKKCGHMGGKVLVPTSQHVRTLMAARLAADVPGVPDGRHRPHRRAGGAPCSPATSTSATAPFITGERTRRGLLPCRRRPRGGDRPWAGLRPLRRPVWCETSTPDLDEARAVRRGHPRQFTRARCWPTTARRRSTGSGTSTTPPSPVPEGAGRDGLPVPVHHAGRVPRA